MKNLKQLKNTIDTKVKKINKKYLKTVVVFLLIAVWLNIYAYPYYVNKN